VKIAVTEEEAKSEASAAANSLSDVDERCQAMLR
jgi:hypothetical protein